MPARWPGLKCHLLTLIGVVFLPISVEAQTSSNSVTLTGTVSETVALSVLPNATPDNVDINVASSGNTVRITLSGADNSAVIRVPLMVRSNSSFKISAAVESQTAVLTQLSVIDARATGTLVSPNVIGELNIPRQFDLRRSDENVSATNSSLLGVSSPFLVLSGPRISLGGTLDSPNNTLQITLLIRMNPQPTRGWSAHLTFVGTAGSVIQ